MAGGIGVTHQQTAASSSANAAAFHLQRQLSDVRFDNSFMTCASHNLATCNVRISAALWRHTFSSSISATSRQLLQQLCQTATSEMLAQFRPPATSTTSAQLQLQPLGANSSASAATQLRSFYNSIQRQCLSPPTVDVRTRSRNRQSALYGGDAAPAAATSVITAHLHCRYCVFSVGDNV